MQNVLIAPPFLRYNICYTHGVMVGVRHGVSNLSPSHTVLDGHLVRRAADHGRFYSAATRRHVAEHGWPDFLLFVPATAPCAQAHQSQHDYWYGRHWRADRHAQHFAVNLALRPVKRSGTPLNGEKRLPVNVMGFTSNILILIIKII